MKFNVPLTAGYKGQHTITEIKLKSAQTDLLLRQKNEEQLYDIRNATTTLNNALNNLQTAKNNYELSRTVYAAQRKQYQSGSLTYVHLLDTEKSLGAAEENYTRSVYDYFLAKLNYDKLSE